MTVLNDIDGGSVDSYMKFAWPWGLDWTDRCKCQSQSQRVERRQCTVSDLFCAADVQQIELSNSNQYIVASRCPKVE